MKKVFALVDCNNFYASCERLFRPELNGQPIVVLSNNDGCVIARSNEAKALGILMGDPYFKIKDVLTKHKVHVFSSNYTLYGDLSHRVMTVLQQLEPEVEVYSIDEAFISLPYTPGKAHADYARYLKKKVMRCVGIPVAIGIGPTKTLAKVATKIAKKNPDHGGAFDITDHNQIDQLLANYDVEDVWGIGRQSTHKLRARGILTARDLRDADDVWIRKRLTVTGLRTAMELRGISCLPIETAYPDKKSIISSRSFGSPVSTLTDMHEAVATYLAVAAEKLRGQGSAAGAIQVFISTNTFNHNQPQHVQSMMVNLPQPSGYTSNLLKAALYCLDGIFKPGYQYKKAGVMLTDIVPASHQQMNLFEPVSSDEKPELMQVVDRINKKWGKHTVQVARAGLTKTWQMVQTHKSPAYTTSWSELPVVNAAT
jgi:DNA polymerase V